MSVRHRKQLLTVNDLSRLRVTEQIHDLSNANSVTVQVTIKEQFGKQRARKLLRTMLVQRI